MTPDPPAPRKPRLLHLFLFHGAWLSVALAVIVTSREVLLPFVLALVVAYVFTPVVARLERARIPRWAAILLTYGVTLGSLYASVRVTAPTLAQETLRLRAEIPALAERLRTEFLPRMEQNLREIGVDIDLDEEPPPSPATSPAPLQRPSFLQRATLMAFHYGRTHTVELLSVGRAVISAVSRGIFVFFLTLMLAAYLMLTRERVIGFFRDLFLPPHRPAFDRFLERADRGLSGVVRGQLLICLVNGVLSGIGFWALGLKYWFLFSVIAGVMSIIPIFGAILSSVPAVAIALTQSFGLALGVLAWIVGIHQLEANFLNPKIIGDAAKIHPVLVVFSLVVGEHLFRLPGALLAVPCLSLAQSLFLHFRDVIYGPAEESEHPVSEAPEAPEPRA
jgi:predicted PurR-regulated permease PerM